MQELLRAITIQDSEDMSKLLASGWSPPRLLMGSSTDADHQAWNNVIVRDWVDGLMLLDKHFPEITQKPEVWEFAVRSAATKCLEYLWLISGRAPNSFTQEDEQLTTSWLMAAMSEPWTLAYEAHDAVPAIQFFRGLGMNLSSAREGLFERGDLREAGHSLFTRAVSLRRWDVALEMWPTPNEMKSLPRLDEVLLNVMEVVVGDYRPLASNSPRWSRPEIPLVSFADIPFMPLFRIGLVDDRFLAEWLINCHEYWPSLNDEVIAALAFPSKTRISPWLRLPLLMDQNFAASADAPASVEAVVEQVPRVDDVEVSSGSGPRFLKFMGLWRRRSDSKPSIPPPVPSEPVAPAGPPVSLSPLALRQCIWEAWRRVLENDKSQTWLRTLASDPYDEDVLALISLIEKEAPDILSSYWNVLGPDNLSPAAIWDLQGGSPIIVVS